MRCGLTLPKSGNDRFLGGMVRLGMLPGYGLILLVTCLIPTKIVAAAKDPPLRLDQAVAIAIDVNPQVRGARYRWESAEHQIVQNYTPADPQFSYLNSDSWRGFLYGSALHKSTGYPITSVPCQVSVARSCCRAKCGNRSAYLLSLSPRREGAGRNRLLPTSARSRSTRPDRGECGEPAAGFEGY